MYFTNNLKFQYFVAAFCSWFSGIEISQGPSVQKSCWCKRVVFRKVADEFSNGFQVIRTWPPKKNNKHPEISRNLSESIKTFWLRNKLDTDLWTKKTVIVRSYDHLVWSESKLDNAYTCGWFQLQIWEIDLLTDHPQTLKLHLLWTLSPKKTSKSQTNVSKVHCWLWTIPSSTPFFCGIKRQPKNNGPLFLSGLPLLTPTTLSPPPQKALRDFRGGLFRRESDLWIDG